MDKQTSPPVKIQLLLETVNPEVLRSTVTEEALMALL